MWRDIIISAVGHALVLGLLILPSMLGPKTFKPVTVVSIQTIPAQSISQLLAQSAEVGEPKPKVPQANIKPEKALPKPTKTKKVQTVKRAEAVTEKGTSTGAPGKNKGKDIPKDVNTEQLFTDSEYLYALVQKIRSNWRYPSLNDSNIKAVVYFRIFRDGTVKLVQVKERSKHMNFDATAYEAVVKSAPFSPLPDSYSGNYLGIYLTFSY
ncbi:MAG: TonB C-terminal domain-containing protein [Candidatus Latescibacterota bacterium]